MKSLYVTPSIEVIAIEIEDAVLADSLLGTSNSVEDFLYGNTFGSFDY